MKDLDLNSLNIGLCISKFNYEYVGILENSIFDELVKLGIREKNILRLFVPGALELPLLLARCAKSNKFDALIAIGAVIRGDTYHFEVVSNESASGIMKVQLEHNIPIMNSVLTTNNDKETISRVNTKGVEVVEALLQTLSTLQKI